MVRRRTFPFVADWNRRLELASRTLVLLLVEIRESRYRSVRGNRNGFRSRQSRAAG